MPTPTLREIEQRLLAGAPKKALEGLLEWVEAYLPEEKNDVIATLSRLNKADQERIRNDITEEHYQTEFTKITLVVQDILQKCRLSGKAQDEAISLQLHHRYTCDRVAQNDEFQRFSRESAERKAQFYYLYGDEQQSHEGFFRRICHEIEGSSFDYLNPHLQLSCRVKPLELTFDFSMDPQVYRMNVLKSLFAALGVPVNEQEPLLEKTLPYVCERSPIVQDLGPDDYLCVLIQIGQWDWDPNLTPDTARWFIYQFAQAALPPDSPRFLFFLGVEFDGSDDTIRAEVKQAVEEGRELRPLTELGMVLTNDIGRWLGKYKVLAPTTAEQRQLMQDHFGESREFYMEDVEVRLERIITEYNNRHLR
jgi:hypothetical protein